MCPNGAFCSIAATIAFAKGQMLIPCTVQGMRIRGIFSFLGKRISPFDPQEKGIRLAVSISNNLYASGMKMPARGVAAFRAAIRFASASIIRCCAAVGGSAALRMRHTPCGCRSAHLVEVHSNHRLPKHSTMRRAPAMPLFRTQSTAKQTSLAPHDSKARLRVVTKRRGSWRSHVHRT